MPTEATVAPKKKTPESDTWQPIEVPARVDENFRPITVGGTAAPVAANTNKKPATGDKED